METGSGAGRTSPLDTFPEVVVAVLFHSEPKTGLLPKVIVKSILTTEGLGQSEVQKSPVPEHEVMVSVATNRGECVSSAISVTFTVPLKASVPLVKLNVDVAGTEVGVKVAPPFPLVTVKLEMSSV